MRFLAVLLIALLDGQRAQIAGHAISGRIVDKAGGVPKGIGLTAWVKTSPGGSNGTLLAEIGRHVRHVHAVELVGPPR